MTTKAGDSSISELLELFLSKDSDTVSDPTDESTDCSSQCYVII